MRIRKFNLPTAIILIVLLGLAGAYGLRWAYNARLRMLEKQMAEAMDKRDQAEVTRLAHSFPCPVNARGGLGRMPLHWAAMWDDMELAKRLLRNGADVNAKAGASHSTSGRFANCTAGTPLHEAAARGFKDLVELLIANGANVNAEDDCGQAPLVWPVLEGRMEVVECLISHGANVNARSRFGGTALFDARTTAMVEFLIAKGADINARNNEGKTSLQVAIENKFDAVAEALRKAGAKE